MLGPKGNGENHLTFIAHLASRLDWLMYTHTKLNNLCIIEKPVLVEDAPSAVLNPYEEKITVIKYYILEF